MSPLDFLQRPLRWLRGDLALPGDDQRRPELRLRPVRPQGDAARSARRSTCPRWKVAFNGAEPVRAETLERFAAAFAPCGFRRARVLPCYGLAEATLFVSGGTAAAGPATLVAADARSARGGGRIDAAPSSRLVGCGSRRTADRARHRRPGDAAPRRAGSGRRDLGRGPERRPRLLGRGPRRPRETFAHALGGRRGALPAHRRPRLPATAASCSSPAGSRT